MIIKNMHESIHSIFFMQIPKVNGISYGLRLLLYKPSIHGFFGPTARALKARSFFKRYNNRTSYPKKNVSDS